MGLKNWFKFYLILIFVFVIILNFQELLPLKELYLWLKIGQQESLYQQITPEQGTAGNVLQKQKTETIIHLGEWDKNSLNNLIKNSKKYNVFGERIEYISQKFLNTSYKKNTLVGKKDLPEKFVVNLKKIDCFTFLDYVLSLGIANDFEDFFKKLKSVRYNSGIVNFKKRNHFFSQWIDNNSNYFSYILKDLQNSVCLIKKLNQKQNGEYWVEGIAPFREEICFLPREIILDKRFDFESGDIVGFYTNLKGLDVTHLGIISLQDSEIYLRHASQKKKKVVDEKLKSYLENNLQYSGLIIVRPIYSSS